MKIIRPMDLTASGVVESNAPPEIYPQWNPGSPGYTGEFLSAGGARLAGSSGDGQIVAFVSSDSGQDAIYLFDSPSGETSDLTTIFSFHLTEFVRVAVSHDGSFVVAAGRLSGVSGNRVAIFDRSSGDVFSFQSQGPYFAISPDSSGVYFALPKSGASLTVNKISIATRAASWVTTITLRTTQSQIYHIGVSATESEVICAESDYIDNIFLLKSISVATGLVQSTVGLASSIYRSNYISIGESLISDELSVARGDYATGNFVVEIRDTSGLSVASESQELGGLPGTGSPTPWSGSAGEFAVNVSSSPWVYRIDKSTLSAKPMPVSLASISAIAYIENTLCGLAPIDGQSIQNWFIDITTDTEVTYTPRTYGKSSIVVYGRRTYQALTDNNDRPDVGAVADPPTWLDLGFINPLRMFDNKLDSRTTAPSPLVIDITPGMLVNGLALFNVDAATVQITYTDPDDGLVYDTGQISMLDNSGVQDWYGFFFDPYLVKADLARVDLLAYIDGTVQITLDGAGADVAIGEVVLGTIYKIGEAQYGSSAGIIDFSRKETDQFGNFEIVPRRFSKRAEFDAVIPPAYGGSVQRTLARLRATPVVWIGSVDLEETIVYGYFREFDILLSNPAFSSVTITVEGL